MEFALNIYISSGISFTSCQAPQVMYLLCRLAPMTPVSLGHLMGRGSMAPRPSHIVCYPSVSPIGTYRQSQQFQVKFATPSGVGFKFHYICFDISWSIISHCHFACINILWSIIYHCYFACINILWSIISHCHFFVKIFHLVCFKCHLLCFNISWSIIFSCHLLCIDIWSDTGFKCHLLCFDISWSIIFQLSFAQYRYFILYGLQESVGLLWYFMKV